MENKREENSLVSRYMAQKLVYRYIRHLVSHCSRLNHWTLDYAFGFRGKSLLHPLIGIIQGIVIHGAGGCYELRLGDICLSVRANGEAEISHGNTIKPTLPNHDSVMLLCQLLRMAVALNNKRTDKKKVKISEYVYDHDYWEVRRMFDEAGI